MSNMELTQQALQTLSSWGVQDVVLCPGGRNAPFVFALAETNLFRVHSAFDERAAAFFALGTAQAKNHPTAIITTSGTAVAEVLPAVIEAHYTQTPLIVISADRPRRMRGTGAPQTIEQINMFGSYVEKCVDIEEEWPAPFSWTKRAPLHLNICFDEPLRDGNSLALSEVKIEERMKLEPSPNLALELTQFLKDKNHPLLLVSGLKSEDVGAVKEFASRWPGFIYAESTSGLREFSHSGMILSGDRFPGYLLKHKKIDAVLRIGGVPTARLWRDLENLDFPTFSISSLPFAGLSRGRFFHAEMSELITLSDCIPANAGRDRFFEALDQEIHRSWRELLTAFPQSEPALVQWLSSQIEPSTTVYVGNSLPIREWDLVAQREHPFHVRANRGANGIDGQIATGLGYRSDSEGLCILIGDLTAIYDSNALWFLKNQTSSTPVRVVVMNNSGGRIFERLFQHPLFYNEHNLHFKSWAESWQCGYTAISQPTNGVLPIGVIELIPNLEQTASFWKKYDQLWAR
jgi:2-succinyl-5-enolpyruvyl-6-hydroxy-3-cyclohexene-1-carboxylate synthase